MRKILCLLIILSVSLCAYSSVYKSNRLAQRLNDDHEDTSYVLIEQDSTSYLYYEGELVRIIERFEDEDLLTVRTTDVQTQQINEKVYRSGLLVRNNETYYVYDGELLVFSSCDEKTKFFIYDTNLDLRAVTGNDFTFIFGDDYLTDNESLLSQISDDFITDRSYTVTEDDNILIEDETYSRLYDRNGDLLLEKTSSYIIEYEYENGFPITSVRTEGERKTITYYEDSRDFSNEVYQNGILIEKTVFSEDGKTVTVFDNGREKAILYYMQDNIRVRRIEYL